jgi:hypothetical protein
MLNCGLIFNWDLKRKCPNEGATRVSRFVSVCFVPGVGLQWWRKLPERSRPVEGSPSSASWRRSAWPWYCGRIWRILASAPPSQQRSLISKDFGPTGPPFGGLSFSYCSGLTALDRMSRSCGLPAIALRHGPLTSCLASSLASSSLAARTVTRLVMWPSSPVK